MAVRQEASTGEFVDDGQPAAPQSADKLVDGKLVMRVTVYSPFKVYFDEDAFSISAQNATGPFDILPKHHNFMCLLSPCELHLFAPTGEKRIRISGGLMQVKANAVRVFLDV